MRKDLGKQPAVFPMPVLTEKVGQAWNAGKEMMKAAQGK